MNIVFLCSLICLGSSISVRDKQLSPLKKIANKSLITSVTSSDLVKVIMDHKKDPEYLLSVLSNVDPTKLNDVLLLVRALLAASEADLVAVTQTSTSANTAYTDATTAYDVAVVARVDLQATKTAFDVAFTANSVLLDQQVAALLVAQTEAHGAKTNAQSTLDTETTRLNGEIETLNQVISLLERLVGSTPVSNIGFYNDIDGGGWQLVRRVKAGNQWHPASDQLIGTDVYGTFVNDDVSDTTFSRRFDNEVFNQFLFSTGDRSLWLVATKDAVINGWYSNEQRDILFSSDDSNAHQAAWYRRQGVLQDPLISLIDHGAATRQGKIVYIENNYGGYANAILPAHQGANVFIRYKATPETGYCMAGLEAQQCGQHFDPAIARGTIEQCYQSSRDRCGSFNFLYKVEEGGYCYCLDNSIQQDGTCSDSRGWHGSSGAQYSSYSVYGSFRPKTDTVCAA